MAAKSKMISLRLTEPQKAWLEEQEAQGVLVEV